MRENISAGGARVQSPLPCNGPRSCRAWPLLAGACDLPTRQTPDASPGPPAQVASSDTGAPRKAPALRVPHPARPCPARAFRRSPRPTRRRGRPPTRTSTATRATPCGPARRPRRWRARALFSGSDRDRGAVALVPRKLLAHDVAALPAVVDHRVEGTEGPVRDQAATPACTAFAAAAAIDHAMARWGGGNAAVSVMQMWSRYHAPEVLTSLSANIGPEARAREPPGRSAPPKALGLGRVQGVRAPADPGLHPDARSDVARAQAVAATEIGREHHRGRVPGGASPSTLVLQEELAAGQDVVLTLEPPPAFVPKGKPGAQYIPDYARSSGTGSGHSLLIAGYAHFPHGTYFLLHNSWGTAWGDGGYAWMHEATVHRWSREAVSIDAEPVLRAPGSRPVRKRAQTTCAAGLVPDSIQATCTPPCPDQSPRHDGVCPVAPSVRCPAGFVNLTGACVLAKAPVASAKDAATRIAWTVPGPADLRLRPAAHERRRIVRGAPRVEASCPAPDFIIARMGDQLVCVEVTSRDVRGQPRELPRRSAPYAALREPRSRPQMSTSAPPPCRGPRARRAARRPGRPGANACRSSIARPTRSRSPDAATSSARLARRRYAAACASSGSRVPSPRRGAHASARTHRATRLLRSLAPLSSGSKRSTRPAGTRWRPSGLSQHAARTPSPAASPSRGPRARARSAGPRCRGSRQRPASPGLRLTLPSARGRRAAGPGRRG